MQRSRQWSLNHSQTLRDWAQAMNVGNECSQCLIFLNVANGTLSFCASITTGVEEERRPSWTADSICRSIAGDLSDLCVSLHLALCVCIHKPIAAAAMWVHLCGSWYVGASPLQLCGSIAAAAMWELLCGCTCVGAAMWVHLCRCLAVCACVAASMGLGFKVFD